MARRSRVLSGSVKIIGAGMVGLALANKLAQAGIAVQLIERQQPNLKFEPGEAMRVSALSLASRDLLKSLSVWDKLRRPCVEPFSKIQAWTESNNGEINFDAADSGKKYLAYVVENREIVRVLWERAVKDKLINIDIGENQELKIEHQDEQLIVGADGARSQVRAAAGIDFKERSYGQHAVVARVHSHKPHRNIAYQNFLKTGPLGILPLHEPHLESIVWSADDAYAEELMAMDEAKFNMVLSNALDLRLGKLTVHGERQLFPLVMRHANAYIKPGIVLIGDAAHTIHPLAGQGVNLGFKDVMVLAECLITAHKKGLPLSALNILRPYERRRKADNCKMLAAMQLFRNHGYQLGWGFGLVDKCWMAKKNFTAAIEV
jgi:2-octaprenylphenol hydroxylase